MRDNDPPLSLTAHCNLTQVQKTSDRWGKHRRSSLQEGNKQGRAEAAEVSCTENRTAAPRSDMTPIPAPVFTVSSNRNNQTVPSRRGQWVKGMRASNIKCMMKQPTEDQNLSLLQPLLLNLTHPNLINLKPSHP